MGLPTSLAICPVGLDFQVNGKVETCFGQWIYHKSLLCRREFGAQRHTPGSLGYVKSANKDVARNEGNTYVDVKFIH